MPDRKTINNYELSTNERAKVCGTLLINHLQANILDIFSWAFKIAIFMIYLETNNKIDKKVIGLSMQLRNVSNRLKESKNRVR